jgi:hypothetical protein
MKSSRFRPNIHTLEGRIAPTIFTPAPAPPVVITITVPTAATRRNSRHLRLRRGFSCPAGLTPLTPGRLTHAAPAHQTTGTHD